MIVEMVLNMWVIMLFDVLVELLEPVDSFDPGRMIIPYIP